MCGVWVNQHRSNRTIINRRRWWKRFRYSIASLNGCAHTNTRWKADLSQLILPSGKWRYECAFENFPCEVSPETETQGLPTWKGRVVCTSAYANICVYNIYYQIRRNVSRAFRPPMKLILSDQTTWQQCNKALSPLPTVKRVLKPRRYRFPNLNK